MVNIILIFLIIILIAFILKKKEFFNNSIVLRTNDLLGPEFTEVTSIPDQYIEDPIILNKLKLKIGELLANTNNEGDFLKGSSGKKIKSIEKNANDELIITMDDDKIIEAGNIRGKIGDVKTCCTGETGDNSNYIEGTTLDDDGNLTIDLSDDTSKVVKVSGFSGNQINESDDKAKLSIIPKEGTGGVINYSDSEAILQVYGDIYIKNVSGNLESNLSDKLEVGGANSINLDPARKFTAEDKYSKLIDHSGQVTLDQLENDYSTKTQFDDKLLYPNRKQNIETSIDNKYFKESDLTDSSKIHINDHFDKIKYNECIANKKLVPHDMSGQSRTETATNELCRQRCASVQGCNSYAWWSDGGCHLQDVNASFLPSTFPNMTTCYMTPNLNDLKNYYNNVPEDILSATLNNDLECYNKQNIDTTETPSLTGSLDECVNELNKPENDSKNHFIYKTDNNCTLLDGYFDKSNLLARESSTEENIICTYPVPEIEVSFTCGEWCDECGYSIVDADGQVLLRKGYGSDSGDFPPTTYSVHKETISLLPGTYTFNGTDTYGDGWNGAKVQLKYKDNDTFVQKSGGGDFNDWTISGYSGSQEFIIE